LAALNPEEQKAMQPAQRFLAVALVVASLAACDQPKKGFDQMKLRIGEHGPSLLVDILKPPVNVGDITSWRTTFPGQVFAAVKTEAPCPRDIHAVVGVEFKKDRIELCYSVAPRDEPVPGFPCSPEVYLKYEIMGVPADVEPTFAFVGACDLKAPATPR
jgi:hypothetical protein